jgi:hypothetical protein
MTRIQTAEMKFVRSINGCTIMDKTGNEEIRKEFEIFLIRQKRKEHRV